MKLGDRVKTAISLPGIPAGSPGVVKETGRLFVLVSFEDGREGYYSRRQLSPVPHGSDPEDARFNDAVQFGIGDMRIARGSHTCLLPSTEGATINAIAAYTAAGLDSGETVVCGLPSKWQASFLARLRQLGQTRGTAGERDQLVLIRPSNLYLPGSHFTGERQLERTIAKVAAASKDKPNGVRAFGLAGRRPEMPEWWRYEELLTPALAEAGVLALCVFDSTGWGTDSWRMAIDLHTYVVRDGHVTHGGIA